MNARESTEGHIVFLDRGDYTTCTIFLQGCTILSWRINNEEQIFLSRVSPLSQYRNIRGGIRLSWPQHSSWSFGKHNGFARDVMWSVIRGPEFLPNGDVFVDVAKASEYYTKSMWNFEFELIHRITLHSNQLTLSITIKNPSKYFNLDFHALLQANIRINEIRDIKIIGLQDCSYTDHRFANDCDVHREKYAEHRFDGYVYKAYHNPPDIIDVYTTSNKLLKITKHNLPDLKVWNPGEEAARKFEDLDDDEYRYFIAIETGFIFKKQPVKIFTDYKISLNFDVIKLDEEKVPYKNFYDYFTGYC